MSPVTRRRAKKTKPAPSRLATKQEKRLQRRSNRPPSPSEESQEEESHESEIEESDSGDEFEVETILDKRVKDGEVHYRVKWRGFDMRYATWEPAENLENAPTKIEAYEKTRKLEEARAKEEKQIETSKEKKGSLLGKRELPVTRSNRRSRYVEEMEEEEEEESQDEEESPVEKRVLRSRNQSVKTRQSGGRAKGKGEREKGRSGGRSLRTRTKKRLNYDESESEEEDEEENDDEEEEEEEEEEGEEEENEESEGDQIESPGKIKSVEREKMAQEEALYETTPEKPGAKEVPEKQNASAATLVVPEKTTAQSEAESEAKKVNTPMETEKQKEVKPALSEAPPLQDKSLTVDSEKPSVTKSPTNAPSKTILYPQENSAFQSSKLVASKDGLIPVSQPLKPASTGSGDLPRPLTAEKLVTPHLLTPPVANPLAGTNNINYLNNQTITDDMALKNFITFQGSLQISNYLFPPRDYGALNANRLLNPLAPSFAQPPNMLLANNPALFNSLALQGALQGGLQGGLPGAALLSGAFANNFNMPLANYQVNPLAGLSAMGGLGNLGFPLTAMDLMGKLQGVQNPMGLEGPQLDQIMGLNMNLNHRLNMLNLQQNLQSVEKKGNSNNEGKKDGLSQVGLSRQTSGTNDVKKNALTTPSQSEKDKRVDGASSQGLKTGSSSAGNDGAAKL